MHNIQEFDIKWTGAYEEQFNVQLFNTAVRLATETTEAHKKNPALLQRLSHLPWYKRVSSMDYFESRDIRYFGELLERYGEKLGDNIANTRAIALAMAWAAPILTPNMFVGKQRGDFMLKLNLLGEGDAYMLASPLMRTAKGIAALSTSRKSCEASMRGNLRHRTRNMSSLPMTTSAGISLIAAACSGSLIK